MPQTVRGVVARGKGLPVTVEQVVVPDPGPGPGPGPGVVRVQACGFTEKTLGHAGQCTRSTRPHGRTAAGLLGCG